MIHFWHAISSRFVTFTQIREWIATRRLCPTFRGYASRKVVHFLSSQTFLFSLKFESSPSFSCSQTKLRTDDIICLLICQERGHSNFISHYGNCIWSGRPNSRCCVLMTFKSTDWKERLEFLKTRGICGIRSPLNLSAPRGGVGFNSRSDVVRHMFIRWIVMEWIGVFSCKCMSCTGGKKNANKV